MIAPIAEFRLPRYEELPDVGLYLEQTVRFVNGCLSPLGEQELTSSMVSNYVKQRLIPAPERKRYNADHIARILFIAVIKPVVSLEGLGLMFELQQGSYSLSVAYNYFCEEFENMLRDAFGIADAVDNIGETQSDRKDLLRNAITAIVNKIYLDRYLSVWRAHRSHEDTAE